jgi:hypothetical protein
MFPIHSEEETKEIQNAIHGLEVVLKGFKDAHDLKEKEVSSSEKFLIDSKLILTLYGYDVFVLFKGLGLAKSKVEAKMMTRYLSMIMYEFGRDVSNMLGKRFTESLSEHFGDYDFTEEIRPYKRRLNEFKQKFEAYFEMVRNNVAAHRDESPHKQLEIIEEIKLMTFIEATQFFIRFNQDLDNYLFALLERIEKQKH